ncbi:hypothetical protein GIB67_027182 [Kingdonia uniflora]|uniref:Transposase n=1 Tax=Kingdonia uniflora TaxID=39325 RepID=A0A7J7P209_9MAGN|nr:hypothetical protein GIB67_027182 [Kingdonia uniflora]
MRGVHSFIAFAKANLKSNEFSSPCAKCQNKRGLITSAQISHHLVSKGIDQSYTNWYFHGEPIINKDTNLEIHGATHDHPHDVPRMLDLVDDAFGKHKIYTEGCTSGGQRRRENITSEKPLQFIPWLRRQLENETLENKKVSVLKRLADGPYHNAISYKAYRANGFVFHTKGSESSTTTQNNGVTMKAIMTFISRKSDPNGVEDETTYYGVVKEILELNYFDFQQTVFYCDWVRIEDKVNGCVIDPETNLIYVNLEKLKKISKEEDEPFILACQASQVFYCKDLTRNDYWHVVLDAPKKLTRDVDAYEDPLVFKGTTHEGSFD